MTDKRLQKVDTVVIDYEKFRMQLRRNYLDPEVPPDESHVLRLVPPFKQKMEAEPYSSEEGQNSDEENNGQAYYIKPELIFEEADPTENIPIPWPTEQWVRDQGGAMAKEVEMFGMDSTLKSHRETYFWLEFDYHKPNKLIIDAPSDSSQTVELEWKNAEF
jgi:hypothetical protein